MLYISHGPVKKPSYPLSGMIDNEMYTLLDSIRSFKLTGTNDSKLDEAVKQLLIAALEAMAEQR